MGEIKVHHFGSGDEWLSKEQLTKRESTSREFWSSQTDDQHQAIMVIVTQALAQLVDHPSDWIPESMIPQQDQRIDIFISVHLAEVDEEVVRRKLESERELQQATEGVKQIEADLRS